jgi:hypothetical protein
MASSAHFINTVAVVLLLAYSPLSQAFQRSDGTTVSCRVSTPFGVQAAIEEFVAAKSLGNFTAETKRLSNGQWRIRFDERLQEYRYPLMADLVFYHECAHAQLPTTSELLANCEAIRRMREEGLLDAVKEQMLGEIFANLRNVPIKYAANGKAYWAATVECAAEPRTKQMSPIER